METCSDPEYAGIWEQQEKFYSNAVPYSPGVLLCGPPGKKWAAKEGLASQSRSTILSSDFVCLLLFLDLG